MTQLPVFSFVLFLPYLNCENFKETSKYPLYTQGFR